MNKKLFAVLMCLVMVVSMLPSAAIAAGSDVTEIATVAQLQAFAQAVNAGDTFAGKIVRLTADIDLSEQDGFMIGSYGKPFSGEFDGAGKTISNLTDSTASDHKGLFAHLNNAYVHDLTLSNVNFSGTCTGTLYAGALVGEAESKNVIVNVDVNGLTWTATSKNGSIGGMAGYSYDSNYINCDLTDIEITLTSTSSVIIGGMVGQGRGVLDFSTAYGNTATASYDHCTVTDVEINVTGNTTVGGFLGCDGYNHWANKASDCQVEALKITCAADDAQYTVGGFMGSQSGGIYADALSSNTVSGTITSAGTNTASTFGGFIGYVGGRPSGAADCTANVSIAVAAGDVGGFCGETQQYFAHEYKFDDCTATGDVATDNGTAGGFIANIQHGGDGSGLNVSITDCTASGAVQGDTASGLIGSVNDVKNNAATGGLVIADSCTASEKVTANENGTVVENGIPSNTSEKLVITPEAPAAKIGTVTYTTLQEAVQAAGTTATTITVYDGTHTLSGTIANKNITVKGGEGAVIEMLSAINALDSTIAFDGVTVKFDNDYYEGLQHATKVTYTNCTHIGTEFLYAPTVSYTGCTFEMYDATTEYAVWTYGASDVTFTDCTFNTNGKAVLVYTEVAHTAEIAVDGCEFNSNGTYTGKAAIELGASANGAISNYSLTITDSVADENFSANNTDSNLWGNKNSITTESGSSVVIDGGENLMPTPAPEAELALKYASLELEDRILIDLYADIEGYDQAYIEANGGMLVWTADPGDNATIENCEDVREGLKYHNGLYYGQTGGIAAKKYADEYYMCIYLKLDDGSYIYTAVAEYSVQKYCQAITEGNYADVWQTLCTEMLEYGAAAQMAYNYNTNDLADAIIKKEN